MAVPTYTTDAAYLAALKDAKMRLAVSGVSSVTVAGRNYSKVSFEALNAEIALVESRIASSDVSGGRTYVGFQRPR